MVPSPPPPNTQTIPFFYLWRKNTFYATNAPTRVTRSTSLLRRNFMILRHNWFKILKLNLLWAAKITRTRWQIGNGRRKTGRPLGVLAWYACRGWHDTFETDYVHTQSNRVNLTARAKPLQGTAHCKKTVSEFHAQNKNLRLLKQVYVATTARTMRTAVTIIYDPQYAHNFHLLRLHI